AVNVYDLAIYIFQPDVLEPNDDPASCFAISSLFYVRLGVTIHDSFDEDWFCFDLPARGTPWDVTIDILFMHSLGDLEIDLFEDQGILFKVGRSRSDNEQITETLPPGGFFIRVYGFGGAVNQYDLSLVAQ
ncbi:MAG: hypothetical protein O6952_05045, partial [Planctomycetota bacterium]|nr:hypothetical protein [Planctomycetota bacterium]